PALARLACVTAPSGPALQGHVGRLAAARLVPVSGRVNSRVVSSAPDSRLNLPDVRPDLLLRVQRATPRRLVIATERRYSMARNPRGLQRRFPLLRSRRGS